MKYHVMSVYMYNRACAWQPLCKAYAAATRAFPLVPAFRKAAYTPAAPTAPRRWEGRTDVRLQ